MNNYLIYELSTKLLLDLLDILLNFFNFNIYFLLWIVLDGFNMCKNKKLIVSWSVKNSIANHIILLPIVIEQVYYFIVHLTGNNSDRLLIFYFI